MNDLIDAKLIENTYLFCLKRVSDTEAAMDLSQDILCAALSALGRGSRIEDFYAWYWRMARNKYADHIRRKENPILPLECAGGAVSELPCPAQSIIDREDLSALHFSLSRLAAVQRELIIRFYLKEQTAEQIAEELGIPLGTVKYRLFDARKNIKERFENMENMGKSAYAPTEVTWFCGFSAMQASETMKSKIAQQVIVICRNEAVSINEIADEMGVAPVYLEQVLEKMEQVSLLKKQGKDKYISNICVFPRQIYEDAGYEAYQVFREGKYAEKITEALLGIREKITALPFYGNDFDYAYLMWILYVCAGDRFGAMGNGKYLEKFQDRYPDEKERTYRITAMFTLPDETIRWYEKKIVGWSNLHQTFDTPDILEYVNDFEAEPFPCEGDVYDEKGRDTWVNASNILLLEALTKDPAKKLNRSEEEQAAKFIEQGLLEKDGGKLKVMLPLIDGDVFEKMMGIIEDVLRKDAEEFAEKIGERVEKILLPYVRKDMMSNFIHWDMRMFFQPIGYLFHYGMYESGTLAEPADCKRSAAGLYIKRHRRNI